MADNNPTPIEARRPQQFVELEIPYGLTVRVAADPGAAVELRSCATDYFAVLEAALNYDRKENGRTYEEEHIVALWSLARAGRHMLNAADEIDKLNTTQD